MNTNLIFLTLCSAMCLLAGCGQSGNLYLPATAKPIPNVATISSRPEACRGNGCPQSESKPANMP